VAKVSMFEVMKRMSDENKDIRLSTVDNITELRKVKAGTKVTIGVAGDVVSAVALGKLVGGLILVDKEQFFATKEEMEKELANGTVKEK
jgi:ethanolamine transporter EutH